ncbi:hypothetical protein DERP_013598 [Dermatophagoides pteronyssinus]|uniref:Uncharacterized protein n=1 Tax=Dermatophagoides pteronyssinus TaxID=6956 RepID=A0ABQ8IPN9_DERPT|nr:hypothetical protein DERP_013598 [Dermatophagoides pteronyssinus]
MTLGSSISYVDNETNSRMKTTTKKRQNILVQLKPIYRNSLFYSSFSLIVMFLPYSLNAI